MNPTENEYENSLANIMNGTDQLELLRQKLMADDEKTRRIVADGANPYGSDVLAKAQAIRRVLGDQLEFSIDEVSDAAIHWRPVRGVTATRHKPVRVAIETFMDVDFTDLDLAREFGLTHEKGKISPQSAEYLRKIRDGDVTVEWGDAEVPVSGNRQPNGDDPEVVATAIARLTSTMALTESQMKQFARNMVGLSQASGEVADSIVEIGKMVPEFGTDTIVARAELGIEAIIMDIHSNILVSDEAVRERASYWLTEMTKRITSALDYQEKEG